MGYTLYNADGQKKYLALEKRRRFTAAAHEATDPAQRTLCLTLAYTGARLSEVVALTDRQIHLTNERIVLESLKKRKSGVFRAVPVPKDLLRTLDLVHELRRRRRTARLLWEVSRTTAWRWVGEVMAAAELSGPAATPKGLRHAFAIAALDKGVPLNMVQKWLGHAQISTTAIYGNAIGTEETALAARLWEDR
jgi:integrase